MESAGVRALHVSFEVGEPQRGVGHDPVELVDESCLRERREILQRDILAGGVGAERLPVVGRGGDCLGEQRAKPAPLEVEELPA